jgi:hypothetical protein
MRFIEHGVAALLMTFGCAALPADKGPEEDAPIDDASDSFRSPIDQGELTFAAAQSAELTDTEAFHAWTFELDGSAATHLLTAPIEPGDEVDTMLYLYREGPRGWGSPIARNDDTEGSLFSAIPIRLEPGRYRVLVKGYDRTTRGRFRLTAYCDGRGCPMDTGCLFGETFEDLHGVDALEVRDAETITSSTQLTSPVERSQIVSAVQRSFRSVRTPSQAISAVDGGRVERLWLEDTRGPRSFVVYELAKEGSSFGAIFETSGTRSVATITWGVITDCSIRPHP